MVVLLIGLLMVVIPCIIAKNRELNGNRFVFVAALSVLAVFIMANPGLGGIIWLTALVLSLVFEPEGNAETDRLDALMKLAELKEKGFLTPEEFEKEKRRLMDEM